ncbi:tetratricopeptide repeat protein [Nonomuraea ferruginea]
MLRDQEAWLKPQHPATLATRYEIARVLVKQGDRAEAERLFPPTVEAATASPGQRPSPHPAHASGTVRFE